MSCHCPYILFIYVLANGCSKTTICGVKSDTVSCFLFTQFSLTVNYCVNLTLVVNETPVCRCCNYVILISDSRVSRIYKDLEIPSFILPHSQSEIELRLTSRWCSHLPPQMRTLNLSARTAFFSINTEHPMGKIFRHNTYVRSHYIGSHLQICRRLMHFQFKPGIQPPLITT